MRIYPTRTLLKEPIGKPRTQADVDPFRETICDGDTHQDVLVATLTYKPVRYLRDGSRQAAGYYANMQPVTLITSRDGSQTESLTIPSPWAEVLVEAADRYAKRKHESIVVPQDLVAKLREDVLGQIRAEKTLAK